MTSLPEGVQKIRVARHADDRGCLTEILRCDQPHYAGFGQVYVSVMRRGVIKAWHAHSEQTDVIYVIKGTAKIGLHDDRPESPTQGSYAQVVLGEEGDDATLVIPPLVWHGVMSLSENICYLNIPSQPYCADHPDELRRSIEDLEDIWTVRDR